MSVAPRRRLGLPLPRVGLRLRVAALLAIAILPIGAVGIGEALHIARETSRLARVELINRTRLAAEEGRVALTAAFGALGGLALVLPTSAGDCSRMLGGFVESEPRYVFAALIRPDGAVACTAGPAGARPDFLEWLDIWSPQEAPRSGVALSAYEPALDTVVLNAYRSVYRDGEHAGTLVLSLPVTLFRTLTRANEGDADFRLALLDWQGSLFVDDAGGLDGPDWAPEKLDLSGPDAVAERVFTAPSRAGEQRSYAAVPMFGGDVHALGSWSRSNLDTAETQRILLAVLFPATMGILAFAVAYFAVHWLAVRHITYLGRIMHAFEGGKRSVRAAKLQAAAPELADLGTAFDRMADRIVRDEQDLQRTLDEKTVLIREVYHRVKNNLQIVISLMNLQMREAHSEEERAALARLQERVMGLAAVHQRLYLAKDLARVRCDELLGEIVAMLTRPSPGDEAPRVECSLAPLELGPDEAIPLALVATEMLANAAKHGATGAGAVLRVVLEDAGEDAVRLVISNTMLREEGKGGGGKAGGGKAGGGKAGGGERDGGSDAPRGSPGLDSGVGEQLIRAFARQLGGTMKVSESDGLHHVALSFTPRGDASPRELPGPGN